jgi:hypothetical protein
MMGAAITKSPAWAITPEEAASLSAAINSVTALYDVPIMNEKTKAWLGLGMVAAQVYGARIATAVMEAKKKPKPAPQPIAKPPQPAPQPFDFITPPGTAAQA